MSKYMERFSLSWVSSSSSRQARRLALGSNPLSDEGELLRSQPFHLLLPLALQLLLLELGHLLLTQSLLLPLFLERYALVSIGSRIRVEEGVQLTTALGSIVVMLRPGSVGLSVTGASVEDHCRAVARLLLLLDA